MNFSQSEKKALLGLLRNPSADGKELAGSIDMSYWNLMKIKKKLVERGILRFIWVPDFRSLGAEIVFSGHGTVRRDEKAPDVSSDLLFFTAVEERKGFGIGLSSNYEQFYDEFMAFSDKYGYLRAENFGMTVLPVRKADIWRLADFYPLLSQDFGLSAPSLGSKGKKSEKICLKEGEKEILSAIIEHPEWSGERIGNEIGVSRQRVLRMRERFEYEGIIERKAVVDLKKMGYEVLLFVTWTMRPSIYRKMYENINKYPLSPIILGISTPMQGMAIAAFRSFRRSREIVERLSKWANPDENLIGEPEVVFLSVQDSVFPKYFSFSDLIKNILK